MYYSSNGVDKEIEPLLPEVGMAVDVGANNGIFFSNSLCFEEKGWTVLCVEPNPLLAEDGRSKRKLWREVAASSKDETMHFRAVGGYPYASASCVHRDPDPGVDATHFQVQALRLDRILEEAGFSRLDLLTVDVEGWENEVMDGFTIERWKPKVIVLESWEDNQPPPVGYDRIKRLEYDNIYVRRDA